MKALIVAGGEPPSPELLRERAAGSDLLIAADLGLEAFLGAGLLPDLAVGDFDSAAAGVREAAAEQNVELLIAPRHKNETDLELAAREAYRRGAREVCILGAIGGRVDHLLGNLSVLRWLLAHGAQSCMEDDQQTVAVAAGDFLLSGEPGETVSIVPAGARVTVSASGLGYPLHTLVLTADSARGVSNVLLDGQAVLKTDAPVFVIRNKHQNGK